MLEHLILGTYTKKTSRGIYQLTLDTEKKKLVDASPLIDEDNPTYLCTASQTVLYTVTKDNDRGGIAGYKKQADGSYAFINKVLADGAPPCYVSLDNDRQLLYAANYHKGTVTVYKIEKDGSIKLTDEISHSGNGPHENQQSAHAHYADLTPDKRVVVCDLGIDQVVTYDVTPEGTLTEVAHYDAEPGTGPRHLVFHPNGHYAYLFGELSSTLIVLRYHEETGEFSELQTISSIPSTHQTHNGGAAIRVSEDGKFLYASNRGHNSIIVCEVLEDGKKIKEIQHISTEGDFPRDFALDPSSHFLIVANQNTDNLTLFERDSLSGRLTLVEKDVLVPECVCVTFSK